MNINIQPFICIYILRKMAWWYITGKFRILHPNDYPNVQADLDWSTVGCARLPPFTIYPVEFTLKRHESINLIIEYVPLTLGDHSHDFVMLCDNCQVFLDTLSGSIMMLDVSIIYNYRR